LNTWLWRRNLADSSVVDRAGPAAIAAEPTANGTPAAPPQSDAIAALLDLDLDAAAPAQQVIDLNPDLYPAPTSGDQALIFNTRRRLRRQVGTEMPLSSIGVCSAAPPFVWGVALGNAYLGRLRLEQS